MAPLRLQQEDCLAARRPLVEEADFLEVLRLLHPQDCLEVLPHLQQEACLEMYLLLLVEVCSENQRLVGSLVGLVIHQQAVVFSAVARRQVAVAYLVLRHHPMVACLEPRLLPVVVCLGPRLHLLAVCSAHQFLPVVACLADHLNKHLRQRFLPKLLYKRIWMHRLVKKLLNCKQLSRTYITPTQVPRIRNHRPLSLLSTTP